MKSIYVIPFVIFVGATAVKPILNSDDEKAVPVQVFDFVYIPKQVVLEHLPAFDRRQLNIKAHKIAQKYNIPAPAFDQTATQVDLVEWYQKKKLSETDPGGEKRKALKAEKCQLTKELDALIVVRKNLIADIQRVNRKIQNDCRAGVRLSDFQQTECEALRTTSQAQSQELMQINAKEREILKKMSAIRRTITLL